MLMLAACSGSDDDGVASLNNGQTNDATDDGAGDATGAAATDEEALLAFAQCMRDNGVENFQDPVIGDDGGVGFGFGPGPGGGGDDGQFGGVDQETVQAAFEACSENLQGVAFGPGGGNFDPSEIQDNLVEFAACLREQGLQVDDPDFSNFGPGGGDADGGDLGQGGGIFGGDLDPGDPDVQAAIEVCQESLGGFGPGGGGPGFGPGGGGGPGAGDA